MMQMKYLAVPLALMALALSATGVAAQVATTGSVVVTIEDQDTARVPGVTVTPGSRPPSLSAMTTVMVPVVATCANADPEKPISSAATMALKHLRISVPSPLV